MRRLTDLYDRLRAYVMIATGLGVLAARPGWWPLALLLVTVGAGTWWLLRGIPSAPEPEPPRPAPARGGEDEVLHAVVARLVADVDPAVRLTWEDGGVVARLDGEVLARGQAHGERREVAAFLAGLVRDAVSERRGRAVVPPCPGHGHAAAVRPTAYGVAWTCPATGTAFREYPAPLGAVAHYVAVRPPGGGPSNRSRRSRTTGSRRTPPVRRRRPNAITRSTRARGYEDPPHAPRQDAQPALPRRRQ